MKYQVTLTNGQSFQIRTDDFEFPQKATTALNNYNEPFINLGGCVVSSKTVDTILPIQEDK